jgi:hypothetical protein
MTDLTDSIPARLAALKTTPLPALKAQWRDLFGSEPPGYNRKHLESRLAYRIQELAYWSAPWKVVLPEVGFRAFGGCQECRRESTSRKRSSRS